MIDIDSMSGNSFDFDFQFRKTHLQAILDAVGDAEATAPDGTPIVEHYILRSRNPGNSLALLRENTKVSPGGCLRNLPPSIYAALDEVGKDFTAKSRTLGPAVGARVLALLFEPGESGFFENNQSWIDCWTR